MTSVPGGDRVAPPRKSSALRWLARLVRLALAIGVGAYLFQKLKAQAGGWDELLADAAGRWPWWAAAVALAFVALAAGALRWQIVLRAEHFNLPSVQVLRIFFIGQFFNAFMPGACGGDLVRAWYAARGEAHGRRAEAATTVFLDRALGLLVFIAFGAGATVFQARFFLGHRANWMAGLFMLAFLGGSAGVLVFLFRRNVFDRYPKFRAFADRSLPGQLAHRMYDVVYRFRRRPGPFAWSTLYSLINLAGFSLAAWCIGRSLNLDAGPGIYFTFFPIVTVISSVPITPGALGVREGLFIEMLGSTGVPALEAAVLSLLLYASSVIWSLVGGLLFIAAPERAGLSFKEALREMRESPAREDTRGAG